MKISEQRCVSVMTTVLVLGNQLLPRLDGPSQGYHRFLGTLVLTSGVICDLLLPGSTHPTVLSLSQSPILPFLF